MKRFFLLAAGLLLYPVVQGQVASTECIVEAKGVYSWIDHQALLSKNEATRLLYDHRYIMRADPKGEKAGGEETRIYGNSFLHHDAGDFEECSDATEAFNYRKHQFMVYRTKSTLEKTSLIPGVDKGIFDHCLVRSCKFIPAPGRDSTSFKQAFLTVDEAGQKKYKVKDLEMVWEPTQNEIISVTVTFTEKSRTVWAMYTFKEIGPGELPASSAAGVFLQGDGLADRYKGAELKDYR